MYLNSLNLCGRLVDDPIFKKGDKPDGSNDRTWGRLAVNRVGSKDEADFIPFVCWGGTARAVAQYAKKGKVLIVVGELRTRSTQRADQSYDNYFECNCSKVTFGPDAKNVKRSDAPAAAAPAASAPAIDPAQAALLMAQLQMLQAQAAAGKAAEAAPSADPFRVGYDVPL